MRVTVKVIEGFVVFTWNAGCHCLIVRFYLVLQLASGKTKQVSQQFSLDGSRAPFVFSSRFPLEFEFIPMVSCSPSVPNIQSFYLASLHSTFQLYFSFFTMIGSYLFALVFFRFVSIRATSTSCCSNCMMGWVRRFRILSTFDVTFYALVAFTIYCLIGNYVYM